MKQNKALNCTQILLAIFFLSFLLIPFSNLKAQKCDPPNLIIVLDKSGSMKSGNKWDQAKTAIESMLNTYGDPNSNKHIRFGLKLFPSPSSQACNNSFLGICLDYSCSQNVGLDVAVADDVRSKIKKKLNKASVNGGYTPITNTLMAIENEYSLRDPNRRSFIIFITDGSQTGDNCDSNPEKVIGRIYSNTKSKTYVIGFGSGVDSSTLQKMAKSGKTKDYYQANNQSQINSALDAIAKDISKELCDGKDNNCDGQIDETFDVGASCNVGVGECINGGTKVCSQDQKSTVCNAKPKAASSELCDGLDNDCDGKTDEDYDVGASCENGVGACISKGKKICNANGKKTVCNAPNKVPSAEICDAQDNDCDGDTDEGFNLGSPCAEGIGECTSSGKIICDSNGGTMCNAPVIAPGQEICDDKDNDCDGTIDNGVTRACSNACFSGTEYCSSGQFASCDAPSVPTEVCDGLDNDCDSVIDENASCLQDGAICLCGECAAPCVRGECPNGYECNDFAYCVKDPCCGKTCGSNEICEAGSCVDSCKGQSCNADEICLLGKCEKSSCKNDPAKKCAAGERCDENNGCEALNDPCKNKSCSADEYCFEGKCLSPCDKVSCKADETCKNGVCVNTGCASGCPLGQSCQNSLCVEDPCLKATCPAGSFCENGNCITNSCEQINCPQGYRCKNNGCEKGEDKNSAGNTSNGSSGSNTASGTSSGNSGNTASSNSSGSTAATGTTSQGGATAGNNTSSGGNSSSATSSGSSSGSNTGGEGSSSGSGTGSSSGSNSGNQSSGENSTAGNSGDSQNTSSGNSTGQSNQNAGANSGLSEDGDGTGVIDAEGCNLNTNLNSKNLNTNQILALFVIGFLIFLRRKAIIAS